MGMTLKTTFYFANNDHSPSHILQIKKVAVKTEVTLQKLIGTFGVRCSEKLNFT